MQRLGSNEVPVCLLLCHGWTAWGWPAFWQKPSTGIQVLLSMPSVLSFIIIWQEEVGCSPSLSFLASCVGRPSGMGTSLPSRPSYRWPTLDASVSFCHHKWILGIGATPLVDFLLSSSLNCHACFRGGLSEGQMETIGFLCWKKVCFSIQHPEMVRFLCTILCRINPKGAKKHGRIRRSCNLRDVPNELGKFLPQSLPDNGNWGIEQGWALCTLQEVGTPPGKLVRSAA